MPCDTITTVQLKLKPEIVRTDWLKEVIERFGNIVEQTDAKLTWRTGSYNRKSGLLTERSKQTANKIRQSYAAALTQRTLGRSGWIVKTVEQGVR